MGKQMQDVGSRYGAPMGRACYGSIPQEPRSVFLFRVQLNSGGYDDGGVYWGIGEPLYCARSEDGSYQQFVRAGTRWEAFARLELKASTLWTVAKPPGHRYEICCEWCGQPTRRWTLRIFKKWHDHYDSYEDAVDAAAADYRQWLKDPK